MRSSRYLVSLLKVPLAVFMVFALSIGPVLAQESGSEGEHMGQPAGEVTIPEDGGVATPVGETPAPAEGESDPLPVENDEGEISDDSGVVPANQSQSGQRSLMQPLQQTITIEISSLNPAVANELPVDASWAILVGGEPVIGDTFAAEHLELPATIFYTMPFEAALPLTVVVDASPTFQVYEADIQLNPETSSIQVRLLPAGTGGGIVLVLDSSNNPVPGATVTLLETEATDVTGEDGRAVFEGLLPDTYNVRVDANGLTGWGVLEVISAATGIGGTVNIQLQDTGNGIVMVLDNDGDPVSGATVTLDTGATDVTDADGRVTFTGLNVDSYDVTVEAADGRTGTGVLSIISAATGIGGTVNIQLPAAYYTLVGVSDSDGETRVPNASVTLTHTDGAEYTGATGDDASDPWVDGIAWFANLPAGDYSISVEAPDGRTQSGNVSVVAGETGNVWLTLDPPTGNGIVMVLDSENNPVEGVTVTLDTGATDVTDEDGRVMFTGLTVDDYVVTVEAADGRTGTGILPIIDAATGIGGTVNIQLADLPVGEGIVMVLDSDNNPVEGATVTLDNGDTGETNDEGRVSFEDLTVGAYDVAVEAADGRTGTGVLPITDAATGPGGMVIIHLADLEFSDVTINVVSLDPSVADTLPADANWTISVGGELLDSDTFAAEHLDLPAVITVNDLVPFGTYDVTVSAGPAFETYTGQLVVNQQTQSFDVELTPVRASAVTVNMVSLDPEVANTLPADANWTISVGGEVLDSDTFAAEHLDLPAVITVNDLVPFGTYDVTVNAGPNFETYTGQLVVNQQTQSFTIELTPFVEAELHTGTVRVVEADETTPVEGADVTIFGPNDSVLYLTTFGLQSNGGSDGAVPQASGVTDADGEVEFVGLEDGVYDVAVVAEDGRTATGTLVIDGADSTSVIVLQAVPDPVDPEDPVDPPADDKDKDKDLAPVTKLPETGAGSDSGTMLLLGTIATALLGAGALVLRQKQA